MFIVNMEVGFMDGLDWGTVLSSGVVVIVAQFVFKRLDIWLDERAKKKGKKEDLTKTIEKKNEEVLKVVQDHVDKVESEISALRDEVTSKVEDLKVTYQGGLDRLSNTENVLSKHMEDADELQNNIVRSNKLIMREKIRRLALDAINRGQIYADEHTLLYDMWKEYHDAWKGNGDLNAYMSKVDRLEIVTHD